MLTRLKKVESILLFLTLLFLPTQLGMHFWPDFAHVYSLRVDYLSPVLYFWDVLVVGLLVVWFLRKPHINKFALNLLLFFLFTQGLSLIGARNIGAGLVRLEQYILAGFFGLYIVSLADKKKIIIPLVLGVIGESFLAILQLLKGRTLGFWVLGERAFTISTPGIAKFDFYGRVVLRPYATFPHPNVLAGYLLIVSSIIYQVSGGRWKTIKLALVLGGIAVFLTMSRTAILAGAAVAAAALWQNKNSKNIKNSIIIIIIITVIISPILFTRFANLVNFDNLTLLRREELINNSWQMFLKNPFFGVGLNNFIPAQAANLITGPSRFLQPVHNIFFLSLAETGIVGLVGFLVLVGYPIRNMVYGLWFMGKTKSVVTMYHIPYTILPWFIIFFLGMFDHYFLTLPQGYRLLFLAWGLTLSPRIGRS